MKRIIQVMLINLIIIFSAKGQEVIKLKDLKTPNSPGFQILDIAPSSIERPTNPKAFAATLMSLTSNGSAIPKNFAMEFSPFWTFKSDSTSSIHKYLNIRKDKSSKNAIFSGILRKMSVSLVSTFSDSTAGSLLKNTNYIAFGIRTNLITIRTKTQSDNINIALSKYSEKVRMLRSHEEELDVLNNQLRKSIIETERLYGILENASSDERKEIQQDYNEEIANQTVIGMEIVSISKVQPNELEKALDTDKEIQNYYKKFLELPVFQLDGAFAYSEALSGNQSDNKRFNRSGFWLNGAYNINNLKIDDNLLNGNFSIIGSIRYISDNVLEVNTTDVFSKTNAFDYGGRIQYTIKDFSISYEYLKREYSNDNSNLNSDRSVGLMEYKINDNLYFTGTYGKNFGEVNTLFTLFGINYGFGNSSLKTD
ncbi:porin family protein [Flavobacterium sp. LS1R49]|uniref:Porin family protein n=1 Tax=Flavobacterium shii TaxID=2987687 RepID=A0A9X3C544_9FLAO|nr:porin family protein [Flavobacterium shii]MCV9929744.1 porin family protein [Flavobacterium shii]